MRTHGQRWCHPNGVAISAAPTSITDTVWMWIDAEGAASASMEPPTLILPVDSFALLPSGATFHWVHKKSGHFSATETKPHDVGGWVCGGGATQDDDRVVVQGRVEGDIEMAMRHVDDADADHRDPAARPTLVAPCLLLLDALAGLAATVPQLAPVLQSLVLGLALLLRRLCSRASGALSLSSRHSFRKETQHCMKETQHCRKEMRRSHNSRRKSKPFECRRVELWCISSLRRMRLTQLLPLSACDGQRGAPLSPLIHPPQSSDFNRKGDVEPTRLRSRGQSAGELGGGRIATASSVRIPMRIINYEQLCTW